MTITDHELAQLQRQAAMRAGADPTWRFQRPIDPKALAELRREAAAWQTAAQELRHPPSYAEYLRSEHWQAMRERKMLRAGDYCANCRRHKSEMKHVEIFEGRRVTSGDTLNVHHLTYERLGQERESDLVVLCRECHLRKHGRIVGETGNTIIADNEYA